MGTCRICLKNSCFYNIFDSNEHIAEKIMYCTSVEVRKDDGFPQHICKSCKRELETSVKFKEKCENSKKLLQLYDLEVLNIKDNVNINEDIISCKDCRIKFSSEAYLNTHIERRHKHRCQICNTSFVSKKMLLEHLKYGHKIERPQTVRNRPGYKCHICNNVFNSNNYFLKHIPVHYNPKHLRCDICNTSFLTYEGFIKHMERYSRIQNFSCKICSQVFYHISSYQSHMDSHNPIDKFKCSICEDKFQSKRNLTRHLRNHRKENESSTPADHRDDINNDPDKANGLIENGSLSDRLMQCELCEKMCWGLDELKHHVMMHMGDEEEKPYVCNLCGDSFKRSNTLKTHFKSHCVEKLNAASTKYK